MTLHVVVADQPQTDPDGGTVADMSGDDAGFTGGDDDAGDTTGSGGNGDNGDTGGTTPTTMTKSGCSMAGGGSAAGLLPLALVLAALFFRRRALC